VYRYALRETLQATSLRKVYPVILKSLKLKIAHEKVLTPIRQRQGSRDARFVVIWEFHVNPRKRRAFKRAYGSDGEWAMFFQTGKGYLGTELICDSNEPDRYITLDHWKSRRHYEIFKRQNRKMYEIIDEKCEALTTKEVEIGMFSRGIVSTASRKPKSEN
jgi:heme-degrading monooxygenase HmoA